MAQPSLKIVCVADSVAKAVRLGVNPEETYCVLLEKGLRQAGCLVPISIMALEGTDLNTLYTDAMQPNPKGQLVIAAMLAQEFQSLLKK